MSDVIDYVIKWQDDCHVYLGTYQLVPQEFSFSNSNILDPQELGCVSCLPDQELEVQNINKADKENKCT